MIVLSTHHFELFAISTHILGLVHFSLAHFWSAVIFTFICSDLLSAIVSVLFVCLFSPSYSTHLCSFSSHSQIINKGMGSLPSLVALL